MSEVTPETLPAKFESGESYHLMPGMYPGFSVENVEDVTITGEGALVNGHIKQARNAMALTVYRCRGVSISGLSATGGKAGIGVYYSHDVTMKNNRCFNNQYWGIFTSFSHRSIVEGNHCSNNLGQHGIYLSNSSDGHIIRGNFCHGHPLAGIQLNGDRWSRPLLYEHEYFSREESDGVMRNNLIEGNTCTKNRTSLNLDGVTDSLIKGNFFDNRVAVYGIDGGEPSSRNVIEYNTFFMDETRYCLILRDGAWDNIIRYNLFNVITNHFNGFAISYFATSNLIEYDNVIVAEYRSPIGGGPWGAHRRLTETSIHIEPPPTSPGPDPEPDPMPEPSITVKIDGVEVPVESLTLEVMTEQVEPDPDPDPEPDPDPDPEPDPDPDPDESPVFAMEPIVLEQMRLDLLEWGESERTRLNNTKALWTWAVQPYDPYETGYPGFLIGTHHLNGGICAWRNNCNTPGGTLTFTRATPGELGAVEPYEIGSIAGSIPIFDSNGDGFIDLNPVRSGGNPRAYLLNDQGELERGDYGFSGKGTYIYRYVPNGDNPPTVWIGWHTGARSLAEYQLTTFTWNGSGYDVVTGLMPIPDGIPQAVLDEISAEFVDGSPLINFIPFDVTGNGVDDLVINSFLAYAPQGGFKSWYLENNGDGTYTDKTADWGLPRAGYAMFIKQKFGPMMWVTDPDPQLHRMIDGSGELHMFVGGGGPEACGVYKWHGSGFTRQEGPLTTALAGQDNYPMELWGIDLTNSGTLDMVYHRPRLSWCQVFRNNGLGEFSHWNEYAYQGVRMTCWDPWGFFPLDMNNNGLIDLVMAGNNGQRGSVSASGSYFTIFKNATENPGNYLKVKLKRNTGGNRYGVGGFVEAFEPGGSTEPGSSALIGRWQARPDGIPVHFGLGSRSKADIRVTWHDGQISTLPNVSVNQTVLVSEMDA